MCAEKPTLPFERRTWEYKIYLDQHNRLNKYPLSEYIMERWNIKENEDTLLKMNSLAVANKEWKGGRGGENKMEILCGKRMKMWHDEKKKIWKNEGKEKSE